MLARQAGMPAPRVIWRDDSIASNLNAHDRLPPDASAMSTTTAKLPPGGFVPRFHPRIIGSAAPVFPGFEVDILDRVPDNEREDAVWHRERARAMLKAHPEIKRLFGNDPTTAFWCLAASGAQIAIAMAVSYGPWWLMLLAAWLVGSSVNII